MRITLSPISKLGTFLVWTFLVRTFLMATVLELLESSEKTILSFVGWFYEGGSERPKADHSRGADLKDSGFVSRLRQEGQPVRAGLQAPHLQNLPERPSSEVVRDTLHHLHQNLSQERCCQISFCQPHLVEINFFKWSDFPAKFRWLMSCRTVSLFLTSIVSPMEKN